MDINWNDFKAFAGSLSGEILRHSPGPDGWKKDIAMMYNWSDAVLTDPMGHGIPLCFAPDVAKIREAFRYTLPVNGQTTQHQHQHNLTLFRVEVINKKLKASPITVRFGPKLVDLQIVDAAAALGYIFSIVEPPKTKTINWNRYWMPLLVLFSKCLYLLFIGSNPGPDVAIARVPVMANVMYVAHGIEGQSYETHMFGATLPWVPLKKHDIIEINEQKVEAIRWRRINILVKELKDAYLPLEASTVKQLGERLHSLITTARKKSGRDVLRPEHALHPNLYSLADTIRHQLSGKYADCVPVQLRALLREKATTQQLQPLLGELITRRYKLPSSSSTDPEIHKGFQDLLRYYITPHMYPLGCTRASSSDELPLSVEHQKSIDGNVCELWANDEIKTSAFARLEHLITWHRDKDDPPLDKFGKCAETYPVVGVGPTYHPDMIDDMSRVRGLAMEPRGIGATDLFDNNAFSLKTLRRVSARAVEAPIHWVHAGVCRYPCSSCRELLPRFGIPAMKEPQSADYDEDMDSAGVAPR